VAVHRATLDGTAGSYPPTIERLAMTSRIARPAARTRRSSRPIALVVDTAFVGVEIAWVTCFVVACVATALDAATVGGAGLAVLIGSAYGIRSADRPADTSSKS
jgi:hypothetical protein